MSFLAYDGTGQSHWPFDGYFPPADVVSVPAGWKFHSMSRFHQKTNAALTLTSGTLQCQGLWLPAGIPLTKCAWMTGSTAAVTPTHQWAVLLDNVMKVMAVTSDKTTTAVTANTFIGSTGTWTWASVLGGGTTFTTGYSGLYYLGIMVTASTMPNVFGLIDTGSSALNALSPMVSGTSSTAQTTPPATAVYMANIAAAAAQFYCAVG
jgi:hypothetical protein